MFTNRFLVLSEIIGIGIMAAISYVPFMQSIFKTAPLTLADWGFLVVAAVTLFFAEEARKWFLRRKDARSVSAPHYFYREGDSLMKVIIVGCGRVGAYTAASLARHGHEVVVIDKDTQAFRLLPHGFGGRTIKGYAFDRAVLEEAGIAEADALVAATSGDNTNAVSARIAKEVYRVPDVVSRSTTRSALRSTGTTASRRSRRRRGAQAASSSSS